MQPKPPLIRHRLALPMGLMLLVLMLDYFSKLSVLALYNTGFIPSEITPFFNVVLVWNKGVSFGFLSGLASPYFLIALSLLITLGLLIWLIRDRSSNPLLRCLLGLAIGGAVGNILNRILYGGVVDFLDFHLFGYHWPAFNVADSAISIAMLLLIALSFRKV